MTLEIRKLVESVKVVQIRLVIELHGLFGDIYLNIMAFDVRTVLMIMPFTGITLCPTHPLSEHYNIHSGRA